jgi:hypothetical protein
LSWEQQPVPHCSVLAQVLLHGRQQVRRDGHGSLARLRLWVLDLAASGGAYDATSDVDDTMLGVHIAPAQLCELAAAERKPGSEQDH